MAYAHTARAFPRDIWWLWMGQKRSWQEFVLEMLGIGHPIYLLTVLFCEVMIGPHWAYKHIGNWSIKTVIIHDGKKRRFHALAIEKSGAETTSIALMNAKEASTGLKFESKMRISRIQEVLLDHVLGAVLNQISMWKHHIARLTVNIAIWWSNWVLVIGKKCSRTWCHPALDNQTSTRHRKRRS